MKAFLQELDLPLYLATAWNSFFRPRSEKQSAGLRSLFLLLLYLFGIYLWGKTFSWGRNPFDFFDWADINVPRIDFVRDAIQLHVLPLHMADPASLHNVTDRYFALPDVITTPQMIVLLFLSIERFIFVDIILHYSIGFLGLLWFYRRYELSPYTFAILFFLFEFNGYIFTHYSIGHFTWAAYFLLPIFFSLVLRFLAGEQGWVWVTSMSFLLFYMVLAGSYHHYIWLLLFLAALVVVCWRRSRWILASIMLSGLLGAIRLLPPVLELADYQKKAIFGDIFGHPSLAHLVQGMLLIQLPMESSMDYYPLNSYSENVWEYVFYVGILGFGFILYFGLIAWLRENPPRWKEFILPVFMLLALSMGSTYGIVRLTGIPLFASERATMRMFSVPLVWCIIAGSILFQEWWNARKIDFGHQLAALMGLLLMFIDLWSNLKAWRPDHIKHYFSPVTMNITGNSVANHPDAPYVLILSIGLGITMLTAIFLLTMSWRETKKGITNNA